jgi:hypothetical protein
MAQRQDMLDETTEEFVGSERHQSPSSVAGVVLPPKRHALAVEGDQAMIADRESKASAD